MDYGNYQNDIIRLETITQDKNNYEEQLEKEENASCPPRSPPRGRARRVA